MTIPKTAVVTKIREVVFTFPSRYLISIGEHEWRFETRLMLKLFCEELTSRMYDEHLEHVTHGCMLHVLTDFFFPETEREEWLNLEPCVADDGCGKPYLLDDIA
ncbi:hypothetical protein [Rhizobium sp. LjRoot254]|uniref:hypothetical protein n=1 Tax=Rhizobium sp. LjRoot254 TaxID=3342297 RepID=UPI003ECE7B26